MRTASIRRGLIRRAGGASMKLRMPASARGIRTSRPTNIMPTTVTPISKVFSVDEVEFTGLHLVATRGT
jgi:hypothetical protein